MPETTSIVPGKFNGKVALLTGAASGIGRATTLRYTAEGGSVAAVDIDADGLAALSEEVGAAGGTVATHTVDVRSVEQCHHAVAACVDNFGRLDLLGNIAGIAAQHRVADVTEQDWDTMNDINLKGPFFLSQAALPHLLETSGSIVNIASNAGLMGQAYTVPYCASKGALVNMTKALAMEFVKTGVRVNAIAPGTVETPLIHNFALVDDPDMDLMRNYMGMRKPSTAAQIAALVAFLASDDASNIHGSIISADGGVSAA